MKDLTKGNIYKTFFLFAIPIVLSGLLSQGYAIINTILAGKLLGEEALAAIGGISPLQTLVNSMFWGYGTGLGIYAAQCFGAKDYVLVKRVALSNIKFIISAMLAVGALFAIFRYPIYDFLNIDSAVIPECNKYFVLNFLFMAVIMFPTIAVPIIHALGDSSYPLYMSIISTVLNITASILSIAVFSMGVEGLSFANIISAGIVSVLYCLKLISCFKKLGVNKERTPFEFKIVKDTSRFSVLTMIQQSIMYFAGFFLSPMLNSLGASATASYTVTLRVYDINASLYINASKTVGNYTAQCFGAQKYNQLKRGLRVGLIQAIAFVSPLLLICIFFPKFIASIFYTASTSAETIHYTVVFLSYCLPFLFINVIANLFHNYFRGVGVMKSLLVTTLAGSVARIIISALLIKPFGIYGYYVGWVASWLFDAAACLIIYLTKKHLV